MSNPMITVTKEMDCSACADCASCGDCLVSTHPQQIGAGSAGAITVHYFC